MSKPPKPAPTTTTSTSSLIGSRVKSGSAHGSSAKLLNAPVTCTYWEIPSARSRRWRSCAYLARSASGSNVAPPTSATVAVWTTIVIQATFVPTTCAVERSSLRHRHLPCTDTSRRGCQLVINIANCEGMSVDSVLIPADEPASGTSSSTEPRYSLLLSTDPALIESAQRLRYDVFRQEPGFTLTGQDAGVDVDRFDEHCDHLLVREDNSGELVGCYRMLSSTGAVAAGGVYTATEFDIRALDSLRPSLVEMGRAVVHNDHRNGAVVLLMWAGILAYLDHCDYDYVTGCVSVPVAGDGEPPGAQIRGVRDFVLRRHAGPPRYRVHPHRPVIIDGRPLDDIPAPA